MPTPDSRSADRTSARFLAVMTLLALAFLLGACATAGAPQNVGENLAGGPAASAGSATGDKLASLADRKIIRTGEIGIEVSNVAAAAARVRALALEMGGYIGDSQSGSGSDSATLTMRIPADRFEDTLARLHAMDGDVLSEATSEKDVTTAVVDLDARLKNLQASEVQYRALLLKAAKIEDILAVQARLDDVRGQIEQLQAQDKELTGLASLATLTVSLVPGSVQQATGNWDPGKTVTDAYASLVGVGQTVANGAIWFAIVWLPTLLVLGILVLLATRYVPRLRRRIGGQAKE